MKYHKYMDIWKNTVAIEDDFDPEKIRKSGQCFRVAAIGDGIFRFIAGNKVLYLRHKDHEKDLCAFDISCSMEEWNGFWKEYFDIDRNYESIRKRNVGKTAFTDAAMEYGSGLRILDQDPWEMLITFIISQRKNMPAIAKAVEILSERFGDTIETPIETIHSFPTPEQLAQATEAQLRECSLGYRAPYVLNAARAVSSGELDLDRLEKMGDDALFNELLKINGIGPKVANCVSLFGFGRMSQVPIDVWIARAIEEEFEGSDPFSEFGDDAGIIQQYVFFYMTDREREKNA